MNEIDFHNGALACSDESHSVDTVRWALDRLL